MTHREGQFAGHGGLRLFWQAWHPEGEARAIVLVAHGYAEHGGRYANLVERLVPRGIAVYALDQRGHGRSEGPRGHVGRFSEFVADLHAFRVRIEEEERGKPLFLLGHSMGGLVAVRYLLTHASGIDGAILSSPALGIENEPSKILQWIARALSWIAPRTSFQGNVDPQFLSHDQSVGRAYAADPLVHRRATARFFTEFKWAMRNAEERAAEIRLPILILQAGDDRLVRAAATEAFAAEVGSEDKELHVYPGLYHEIFNETDNERVFADLEHWLESRLMAPSVATG
jgi:alpha-beta hydrolase superfamily lysophospholipase